jgi:hypothetical protein
MLPDTLLCWLPAAQGIERGRCGNSTAGQTAWAGRAVTLDANILVRPCADKLRWRWRMLKK